MSMRAPRGPSSLAVEKWLSRPAGRSPGEVEDLAVHQAPRLRRSSAKAVRPLRPSMLSTVISLALFAPAASYARRIRRPRSEPAGGHLICRFRTRVPLVLMDAKVTEIMMPALSSTMTAIIED